MPEAGIGFNGDVPVAEMIKYVKRAESSNLESFWLHEHSFSRDAFSYLCSAAQVSSKIKLGAGCFSPFTRHPIVLAMTMATLQETTGGRAILGIGTGFPARLDMMGINHDKPIGVLKETIEICRKLWNGETLNFQGKYFSLKNVKSIFPKPESKIPIFIAGWKKQMLALCGTYADGYIAKGGESPQSLGRIVGGIKRSAEKHGRGLKDVTISAYLLSLVASSTKDALDTARKDPFVAYMLSVQDDYLYEETGIDPASKKPIAENYFKGRLDEARNHITDEILAAFTLCGTNKEIESRVQDYKKSGLDLPIMQPISMKNEDVLSIIELASGLAS